MRTELDSRLAAVAAAFLVGAALLAGMTGCSAGAAAASGERIVLPGRDGWLGLRLDALNLLVVRQAARSYAPTVQDLQRFGQIEIPKLGLRAWLVQGTTKEAMLKGAGHIEQTTLPGQGGNSGIAGDRVLYGAPFLRLDQLGAGDLIVIHMPYGDLNYRVEQKFNVDPTQVDVLNPRGYDSITLSTCDPPWQVTTRMIVSARLESADPKA